MLSRLVFSSLKEKSADWWIGASLFAVIVFLFGLKGEWGKIVDVFSLLMMVTVVFLFLDVTLFLLKKETLSIHWFGLFAVNVIYWPVSYLLGDENVTVFLVFGIYFALAMSIIAFIYYKFFAR